MLKGLNVFTTFIPVVGSLGYLYYLGSNGQVKFNVSLDSDHTQHVKKIFDFRVSMESDDRALFKKMISDLSIRAHKILFQDDVLTSKFGPISDLEFAQSKIESENTYQDFIDQSKSNAQSILVLRRKRELFTLSQIIINFDIERSNLYFIFPRINYDISSIDLQTNVNKKLGTDVIRKFEKLELTKGNENANANHSKIKKSKHIIQPELFLNTLSLKKTDNSSVLNFVRDLIEDNDKLNKFGRPLKLTYVKSFNDDKNQKYEHIKVEGRKEAALVEIISDSNYRTKHVYAYYDINEKMKRIPMPTIKQGLPEKIPSHIPIVNSSFLQKYTKHDPKLEKVLQDIKLNELIDKQVNQKKEINSIGKPFNISIDPKNQFVNETDAVVKIHMDGKLNQGELTLEVKRSSSTECWSVAKSDIKVLWNIPTKEAKADEINTDEK